MKILGIDVGVSQSPTGWAFFDSSGPHTRECGTFWATENGRKSPKKDFYVFWKELVRLFDLWKPEKVAVCRPMGEFAGTIYQQAKLVGLVQFLCQRRGIHFVDKPDTLYRDIVFKKKIKKDKVREILKMTDPDEADAMVAALAAFKGGL